MTICFSKKTRLQKSQIILCTISSKLKHYLLTLFSRFENGLSELSNILHRGFMLRDDSMYQMSTAGCKFFMTVSGVTVLRNNRFCETCHWLEWSVKGASQRHLCPALVTLMMWRHIQDDTHSVPALFYDVLFVQKLSLRGTTWDLSSSFEWWWCPHLVYCARAIAVFGGGAVWW